MLVRFALNISSPASPQSSSHALAAADHPLPIRSQDPAGPYHKRVADYRLTGIGDRPDLEIAVGVNVPVPEIA